MLRAGAAPGTSLDGLTYLVIGDGTGGSGVIEATVDLSGYSVPGSGYFVGAESSFTLGAADITGSLNFENSDNVTHVLVAGFSGAYGDDLDTDDDGVLDVTPWTAMVDSIALVETPGSGDKYYGAITVGPDGSYVPGHAFWCPSGWEIGGFTLGTNDTPGAANDCPIVVPEVSISEIRIDQPSSDYDEYFELMGSPGASLDGMTYIVIGDGTGGSGVIEHVLDLTGSSIPGSGYFVAAESSFSLGTADVTASLGFENSDNVTHMLVSGFSGAKYDDLDTDDDGVLDITPWTSLVDSVALVESPGSGDKYYGPVAVGPDGSYVPGHVYLCPDGWEIGGFGLGADDTPGAANPCVVEPPVEACGDPFTPIYTVQGNGLASPLDGSVVSTEGVVTGDFQNGDQFLGFFVQDVAGDGDAATSDGIFVYAPGSVDVAIGDSVRVKGDVDEFFNMTEITNVSSVQVCSTGGSVAVTALTLPVGSLTDFEPFEGMYVTFPQVLSVTETYVLGRYGQVSLSLGRIYNPTHVTSPGPAANAQQDLNDRSRIVLDDGNSQENIDPTIHPFGGLSAGNTLRSGSTVSGVTGVLDYSFGEYRLQPTVTPNFVNANPRTPAPADVGGTLKVASFNVLNFFNGDGLGGGFPTSRGADSAFEFTRQRDKIINAILDIDADILGLMEIENDGYAPTSAIQDLVNGLNAVAGAGTYAFIDPGVAQIGTDEIAVGLLYKPGSVTPIGPAEILDSSDDPTFNDDKNRPVLAQTFDQNTTGERLTVAVNHLKSKGSNCNSLGDPDTGDGQGNCNITRTTAAIALANWLGSDPTGSGDSDFLIMGDLNAYAKEDPIMALIGAGFTDLINAAFGGSGYSYVFDGQWGYLDHAMSSSSLTSLVTGADVWHINADEPLVLDYNVEFKTANHVVTLYSVAPYRASDHDPVLVGMCLDTTAPVLEITATPDTLWPPQHQYVDVNVVVNVLSMEDDDLVIELISVTSDEADNGLGDGDMPDDIVIVDGYNFQLRAERDGTDTDGRTYTITYRATDSCGNVTVASVLVFVPHSQTKAGEPPKNED
ncbi:MAG: ExeM/NucH family extracellular endonuclease [Anaerolineae bacterium]|nr:ExeM/NucH family extracellular endonuclease [Anaerolineae bacterium]